MSLQLDQKAPPKKRRPRQIKMRISLEEYQSDMQKYNRLGHQDHLIEVVNNGRVAIVLGVRLGR